MLLISSSAARPEDGVQSAVQWTSSMEYGVVQTKSVQRRMS